ncbi:hypothetical protein ACWCPM_32270 [Streptomyces sp. NPDC002309]
MLDDAPWVAVRVSARSDDLRMVRQVATLDATFTLGTAEYADGGGIAP